MAFKDMTAEEKLTIIQHLEELRKSLIICLAAITIAAVLAFYFNEQILAIIIQPLSALNEELIVTGVTEAFFVKLKLAFMAGFVIAFPVVVWAVWRFFQPALYENERKYIYYLFPVSIALFAGGILFAYFGILQLVLNFFIYIAGENLETMFKVDQYVSFVIAFTLPFGIVFELPVVAYFLTKLGIVNRQMLAKNRKYAFLIIIILAAALTPGPDPFSQILMAGPVYLLYEASIIVAKYADPERKKKKTDED